MYHVPVKGSYGIWIKKKIFGLLSIKASYIQKFSINYLKYKFCNFVLIKPNIIYKTNFILKQKQFRTKLEFQEKVLKLALKSTLQSNTSSCNDNLNFLFVSSVHVDNGL